jgi:hypothetical protein
MHTDRCARRCEAERREHGRIGREWDRDRRLGHAISYTDAGGPSRLVGCRTDFCRTVFCRPDFRRPNEVDGRRG